VATATYSVKVDAGGDGTASIRTQSPRAWVIAQISIELADAPTGATADVRKNGYLITPLIAVSDVAAGEPYVLLLPSDELTVNWYGATPNTFGKVLVFYEESNQ
jgi:hypothetical protein